MALTKKQIERILSPRPGSVFDTKNGLTYIPQQEVRAELIRTFGPGNVDHTMTEPQIMWTEEREGTGQRAGKTYHVVCAMVGCTLRIRDYWGNPVAEFTEWHVEANAPQPDRGEAYALAVTSAQSYALRRAAISLGDNMGLHLYSGGQQVPLVRGSLVLQGDPESPLYEEQAQTPTQAAEVVQEAIPSASVLDDPERNS